MIKQRLFKIWNQLNDYAIVQHVFRNSEAMKKRIKDQAFLQEFWHAHAEWQTAMEKINYVESEDQMDYTVFLFEAKQKRFEMLLRLAKKRKIKATSYFR